MSKVKFIYMTDPHVKGSNPSSRTDDFPETILKKIEDWFEEGVRRNVDFYLCGGDILDSARVSNRTIDKVVQLFDKYLKQQGKEMFFVWGNHDIFAWNPNTAIDTSLGLVVKYFSDITVLSNVPTLREYNGVTVSLTGVSSYSRLDKDKYVEDEMVEHRSVDYIVDEKKADIDIHVVHGYLSTKEVLEEIPHTLTKDIMVTEANFTLSGHEHTGFPPIPINDKQVICNPGALGRVFASRTEMNRMPQYFYGEADKDGNISYELIQCPIALLGEQVMDRKTLDEKAIQEKILSEARGDIEEVLKEINVEQVDLKSVLQAFEETVEEKYYKEAMKRMEEYL